MNLPSPKKLSKSCLIMTVDMRGVKVKKHQKKMNYSRYQRKMLKKHTMNHHLNQ